MKLPWFTFSILIVPFVVTAKEGLYKPTLNILNSDLSLIRNSVISFKAGSGVYIGENKILTAYHVVAACGCPKDGNPKKCDMPVRSPSKFDPLGNVTEWKTGKTLQVLACGENADQSKSQLYEKTLKTIGFRRTPGTYDDGKFWPRQDLAVLEVKFERDEPPVVKIRKSDIDPYEKLYVMGFPGRTLRSVQQKALRSSTVLESFNQLAYELEQLEDGENWTNSFKELKLTHEAHLSLWSDRLSKLPIDSDERNAILFGAFDLLTSVDIFLNVVEADAAFRSCQHWSLETDRCQFEFLRNLLVASKTNAYQLLNSINLQSKEIDYPNADQTLRVSIGHLKFYQSNPIPNFPGALWTDIDGASGNSGGPLFDESGKLAGILVLGPEGTSMGYVQGKGIGAVSHYGINRLLSNLKSSTTSPAPPNK